MTSPLRALSLASKFLLELGAFAAPFELSVFALAVAALLAAGAPAAALALGLLTAASTALLTHLRQWEA